MSIFRSSSDMWCHKSFAQHFRVAAVGLGMCVILWHQCRPLQGTGNSHMHCAMRSVMFYHGRSEATIPFWPPFFHVSSSRYQVDAASQEFLREKTKTI